MISNPFYLLTVVISAMIAFFTMHFMIESVIGVFRVRSSRMRSILRLFPFFSLIVDLLFNRLSLARWINPLSCVSCVQKFVLESFFPQLKTYLDENEISLVNYLGESYQSGFFAAVYILFIGIASLFFIGKLMRIFLSVYSLRYSLKNHEVCNLMIKNPLLTAMLQKYQVKIYRSDLVSIPMASYPDAIIIPNKILGMLSQEECEAVIAHELEHIKCQDPMMRLFYHLVAAVFWWVPTGFLMKKIENDQEMACDRSVLRYGIRGESIASALVKVAKHAKASPVFCYFTHQAHPLRIRLEAALGICSTVEENIFQLSIPGIALGLLILFTCV